MPKRKTKPALTPAQMHFVNEWLVDHNGTRAYKVAYSRVKKDATAKAAASRLLTNVNLQTYIKAIQTEISAKFNIARERILQEESCIAFSNLAELFKDGVLLPLDELPEPLRRALSSVEVQGYPDGSRKYKYRLWDKGRALERVSKHLGLYEKDNRQKRPTLQIINHHLAILDQNRFLPDTNM